MFPDVVDTILNVLNKMKWLRPGVWGFDAPIVNAFDETKLVQVMKSFSERPAWDPLALRDMDERFNFLVGRDQNTDGFWVASYRYQVRGSWEVVVGCLRE